MTPTHRFDRFDRTFFRPVSADARQRREEGLHGSGLRDVQHALALEHGLSGWPALKAGVADAAGNPSRDAAFAALLDAANRGDAERIAELLDSHPGIVNERGRLSGHWGSRTALHFAINSNDEATVKRLLDRGADPEAVDAAGLTPLDRAALGGEIEMAQLLIERGAVLQLPAAIGLQKTADIERLVLEDPDCLKPGHRWGTLIVRASEGASARTIEELIRLGASVDARDDPSTAVDGTPGYTPLHAAAFRGSAEVVSVLLKHGADPCAMEAKHHAPPAGWADYAGHFEVRDLILEAATADPRHAEWVASFLKNASLDWRVGGSARVSAGRTADRLLRRHPEIVRDSIYTAVVCGDLDAVQRLLAPNPEAASTPGGPRVWPPLLYLCSTRLSHPAANDNAVAIARALLDRGADPNAWYPGGNDSIHYTALTCVFGEGEENAPRHPQFEALTRLLFERGAEPYDMQVVYNTHFHGDMLWLLEQMHAQAVKLGRQADWDDPNWSMLDMGGYGCGARYLLGIAVDEDNLELADWILAHGASPNPPPARDPRTSKLTLHEEALRQGRQEMADLLVRHGAPRVALTLEGEDAFAAACFRLDRDQARALAQEHPEYLRSTVAMFAAARHDRADVVALLLDLGTSADVEDAKGTRTLHEAAYADAAGVTALLIERGADVDARETQYDNTPLGHAVYGRRSRTIDLLARVSRDVFVLTCIGAVERLRTVLGEEPDLARIADDGQTPLMWLPDDDDRAMEIARLLLGLGADASIRDKEGHTAADRARTRGLDEVAELLSRSRGQDLPIHGGS